MLTRVNFNVFSTPASFEYQDSSVGTCLQIHVCSFRSGSQILFHRDGVGAVMDLCVPNKRTVCNERTVTLDSVKLIVNARDP